MGTARGVDALDLAVGLGLDFPETRDGARSVSAVVDLGGGP